VERLLALAAGLRAHCLAADDRWDEARKDAEQAFALACQLGDPCWEGMAGRALAAGITNPALRARAAALEPARA
jgi:hypothetical protein